MEKEKIDFIVMVHNHLVEFNFSYDVATFIACQFALESDFGRSNLAVKHNNYCGMKTPLVRISSATNAGRSSSSDYFAKYPTMYHCILDFVLCLQYHRPLHSSYDTIEHFAFFIKKFYCPEKDYIDKINSIYSQFKNSNYVTTKSSDE